MVQRRAPLDGGQQAFAQRGGEPRQPGQPLQHAAGAGPGARVAHEQHARQHDLLRHQRLPVGRGAGGDVAQHLPDGPAPAQGGQHGPARGGEARRVGVALVADDVAAVLHVVVQRPVDVADGARHQRVQPDPVVVVGGAEPLGEGQHLPQQRGPEQAGGAHHGVGREQARQRGEVVAPRHPEGVGAGLPFAVDDAGVGIGELGGLVHRPEQRLDLVGVPAVVLVGERHERGVGRHGAQRALEIAVEVEAVAVAEEDEARVVEQRRHAPQREIGRSVVRHDADPVAVGLRLDGLDLCGEEAERRVVGRHADGDARPLTGPGDRGRRAAVAGQQRQRADGPLQHGAVARDEPQADRPLLRPRHRGQGDHGLEAAEEAVALGVVFELGVEHVGAGLGMVRDRDAGVPDHHVEEADAAARHVGPAADEQRRAEAGVDRARQRLHGAAQGIGQGRVLFFGAGEEAGERGGAVGVGKQAREAARRDGGVGIAAGRGAVADVVLGGGAAQAGPGGAVEARGDQARCGEAAAFEPQRAAPGVADEPRQQAGERVGGTRSGPAVVLRHRASACPVAVGSGQKADAGRGVKRRRSACGPGS